MFSFFFSRIVLVAALTGCVVALAGCAIETKAQGGDGTKLEIVATTTQLADFSREVVGDSASVTQLIRPNQSAHEYDPVPADLMVLRRADLIIAQGSGFETWLSDLVASSGFEGVTVDTSQGIGVSHDDEEGHHDQGPAGDPHTWLNVANVRVQVSNIARALATADPENATFYEARSESYDLKLAALDEWIRTTIEAVPVSQRLFVGYHDAFSHFARTYGIRQVGSVVTGLDEHAEPSVADMNSLIDAIRVAGVTAIFVEAGTSVKAAETLARETGVSVFSGDKGLYIDSLGAAGSAGSTYIDSQVHNVTMLMESWGFARPLLPRELTAGLAGDDAEGVTAP